MIENTPENQNPVELPKTQEELNKLIAEARDEARLDGAKLVTHTVSHLLGNALAKIGFIEIINSEGLPPEAAELIAEARAGFKESGEIVKKLGKLKRVDKTQKIGTYEILDLDQAMRSDDEPASPEEDYSL